MTIQQSRVLTATFKKRKQFTSAGDWLVWLLSTGLVVSAACTSFSQTVTLQEPASLSGSDLQTPTGNVPQPVLRAIEDSENPIRFPNQTIPVVAASAVQPTPFLEPRINIPGDTSRASPEGSNVARSTNVSTNNGTSRTAPATFGNKDVVTSAEALPLASSDLGNLLKKSPSSLSVGVQSKTPIVSDPRIRGSRIGSLAASGSHWVPARIDLDTILSKFDSRQIESVTITPGPFTSLLGPGFSFTDVQLLRSPRYRDGPQAHGSTDADYRANGNQVFGQQSLLFGSTDWGARFMYANRQGDDYTDGSGTAIPSSYKSQEMTLALGRDWKNDSIELNVLRLDQTDVIFPGYFFDMDFLVTEGYELTHVHQDFGFFDRVQTDIWYNRTRFAGNAQNPRKRAFFPVLDLQAYQGSTNVDSMSTGYRQSMILGGTANEGYKFTAGHDLRFVRQELNEFGSGLDILFGEPFAGNSPIPKSFQVNPGLFAEYEEELGEATIVKTGSRIDFVQSDITADPQSLAQVGLGPPVGTGLPASYADIVGTNQSQQDLLLLSGFGRITRSYNEQNTGTLSLGYAERSPNLTELYAAQPFMLVLQNGLNNVTGDPTLSKEKLLQLDIGWEYQSQSVRSGVRGFHVWGFDYITFENTDVQINPITQDVSQVSLRYVNTDLATLTGSEAFLELMPNSPFTPFGTVKFVEGRDHTRNGRFGTTNGTQLNPSEKNFNVVRGFFSGVVGGNSEPLPSIAPLEARIGGRLHDTSPRQSWNVELSARIVDQQNRVARTLFETVTPGFTTWDLRSVFRPAFSDKLVIAMGVDNILNLRYREHFDFRTQNGLSIFQPGASFYLSTGLTY